MRVLLDVDVVMDVLLNRKPHVAHSAALLAACEEKAVEGLIAAHSLPTIFYLVESARDAAAAHEAVYRLSRILEIVPVDAERIAYALALEWKDFEDALQAACAAAARADAIATRNVRDYGELPIPVARPAELMGGA